MTLALRLLVGLVALALLAVGAAFALAPGHVARDFAVAATGLSGWGTLRADLGGSFVALGAFTLAGVRRARWLAVPAAFIGAFLVLRVLHLAVDGVTDAGLRSTVVELVLLALLLAAQRRLGDRA